MNHEELYQRQQQIYRLHRKIRDYTLTPEELIHLQKSQQQQQLLIESKFLTSKSNKSYKFPRMCEDQYSPTLGFKDKCDLNNDSSHVDSFKKQSSNPTRPILTKRSIKSPEPRYLIDIMKSTTSLQDRDQIPRQSYSPRNLPSRVFCDNRMSNSKHVNYTSPSNDKSFSTLRMLTDSCELKSSNNLKNSTLCQSIKSIVRIKNGMGMTKKVGSRERQSLFKEYESTGPAKAYKNTLGSKGKQNEIKSKYGNNKKSGYNNCPSQNKNSDNKMYTQHDRSLKDWNRSYFSTNTNKDQPLNLNRSANGLYESVKGRGKDKEKDRESVFASTHKWLNTTNNQEHKQSTQKYLQKRPIAKKEYSDYQSKNKLASPSNTQYNYKSYKSSLNQTDSLKPRPSEVKQSYFSKVLQNIRSKNNESLISEALYNSCSRIPLSSPLSHKYLDHKQPMTLTNR